MTNLFECADGEVFAVINGKGEKVPVIREGSITLENLAGGKLKLTSRGSRLTCEAKVPESAESLKWEFRIESESVTPVRGSIIANHAADIESLISEGRVALNGRL